MRQKEFLLLCVLAMGCVLGLIVAPTGMHASGILALPPTVVQTNKVNTFTSAGTLDLSAALLAADLTLPTDPSYVNGDCGKLVIAGGKVSIGDSGAPCGSGSGSVTNIATSSPISGGPITTTGTISCPTCVVATAPGAGVAHFAGSTQTVTSSPVSLTADVSGLLPAANMEANALVRSIGAGFDGGGTALTSGSTATAYFTVPFACTITAWNITVDAGTITFDVWKIATGTAIPTVANTITASALPAIASGTAIHSTTLTGWTTAVAANDIFGVNINTVATATKASLVIQCNAT